MDMTKKERLEWLTEINRIHNNEKRQRDEDAEDQLNRIIQIKTDSESY